MGLGGMGSIALGQVLAVLVTVTNISSTYLAKQGVSIPTAQSALNYYLLAAVYGIAFLRRGGKLNAPWHKYAALALVDVEGNYALVRAYQYTSITSVTLLDSATIPMVLFLSTVGLRARYGRGHLIGAALCIVGLVALLSADIFAGAGGGEDGGEGSDPALGDMLVIVGSLLYACCNVGQEYMLGSVDSVEMLAMQGLFGSLWGTLQLLLFERRQLESLVVSPSVVLPFLSFTFALFAFYAFVPFLLARSGSAVLNLSLLSSDVWAVGARVALFGGFKHPWEAAAFASSLALVSAGIATYSRSGEVYTEGKPSAAGAGVGAGPGAGAGARVRGYGELVDEDDEVGLIGAGRAGSLQGDERGAWGGRGGRDGGGGGLRKPPSPVRQLELAGGSSSDEGVGSV